MKALYSYVSRTNHSQYRFCTSYWDPKLTADGTLDKRTLGLAMVGKLERIVMSNTKERQANRQVDPSKVTQFVVAHMLPTLLAIEGSRAKGARITTVLLAAIGSHDVLAVHYSV